MNKKGILLFILNIVEILLSLVAFFLFTIIFRYDRSSIRYLFLIGDIYVIYSFSKAMSSLEETIQRRNIDKVESKVRAKYQKKLSV